MRRAAPKFPPPPPGYFPSFDLIMSTTPKTPADLLLFAAIDCAHHIEDGHVTLKCTANTSGHNALHQLGERLAAALPRAAAALMPPAVSSATVVNALTLARAKAKEKRAAAGFDGRMDDGGAGHLEALCNAYQSGRRGEVPDFLTDFVAQAEREADPEWCAYQRLHAKFGGKA